MLVLFFLILSGCASLSPAPVVTTSSQEQACFSAQQSREISSLKCSDLLSSSTEKITGKTIEMVKDLTPGIIAEEFWSVVKQLSLNSNSKIELSSDKINLTQTLNSNQTSIHATYSYDPIRNEFVIESVSTKDHGVTTEIPIRLKEIKTDADLNDQINSQFSQTQAPVQFKRKISYVVYEKIKNELHNFDFFTTHELYKISLLDHKNRVAKYNFMLNTRKIKKYIANTILEDMVYSPLRTFVISVVSLYAISSQVDVKKMIGLNTDAVVPEWVAPSVVNMTEGQSVDFQKETVRLMKIINTTESEKTAPEKDLSKTKADTVKINETDFYMIKTVKNKDVEKTYFILTHEKENGSMDVFYQQIDPTRFPHLVESSLADEK